MKVREILSNFIYNLDDFISAEAVVDPGVKLIFATEPQKVLDGYVAYGAIQVGLNQYDFEVRYDKHLRMVEISSPVFWFRKNIRYIRKFLEELSNS